MFGFFGGGMGGSTFEAHYRAMPVAFIDKQSAEFGDKVILPPSALDRLASLHIEYPMLFKVESPAGRVTHCGVLEFVAQEGVVYMPHWMMQNMLLEVGDMVKFRNVSLPKGTYVKLQPVTSDFLDISNPKAVLERTLRSYTCLTVGDCFVVNYNNKNYEIEVKEAKPGRAISVVETDCQVDFEAPKDYKEPERVVPAPKADKAAADKAASTSSAGPSSRASPEPEAAQAASFLAFAGTARRLDGKPAVNPAAPVPVSLGGKAAGASGSSSPAGAPAASGGGAAGGGATGGKAGTFVSTGNRLLDKLAREKMGKAGPAVPAPAPAGVPAANSSSPVKPNGTASSSTSNGNSDAFKAFQGKGHSLKG